ncbi:F0F1 ATP synthase subunit delta [Marinobacter zhejiangensis]|uniref:ATP synthase subunit b n=1 Tax=Marinobacter zhejiangensis TaxID=488535 RepID=A0A1I4TF16_9GAMM|nr:F0F1 ATP synthase subunit delta [Marinobacter zhejiangensis]SFM75292.1 F-type H+-transporting ATPase subunit b [Marinobacter zhejiangensis]
MELNWSTFLLEVLNFVILIWILKRFLYKPVLAIIDRRRENIEQQLTEAQNQRQEAKSLQKRYETRLEDWEQQRRVLMSRLNQDLDAEKARQRELLANELQQERQKAQHTIEQQQSEATRATEMRALQLGARFATHLLEAASGPDLETRLLKLTIESLSNLSDQTRQHMTSSWHRSTPAAAITSAYPIADDLRRELERTLLDTLQVSATVSYDLAPELIAGVRISIGAWQLNANVRDELSGFAELSYGAE